MTNAFEIGTTLKKFSPILRLHEDQLNKKQIIKFKESVLFN